MIATFNFQRPFDIKNVTAERVTMDIDFQKNYTLLMNWGIFKNHDDTNPDFVYGAQRIEHAQVWQFYRPTLAT